MPCNLTGNGIFQIFWEYGDFHWYQGPAQGQIQAGLKQRSCAWACRGVACQICTAEARAAHPHQGSSRKELKGASTHIELEGAGGRLVCAQCKRYKKGNPQSSVCVPPRRLGRHRFGVEGSGPASPQPRQLWRRRRRSPKLPGCRAGTCGACSIGTRK